MEVDEELRLLLENLKAMVEAEKAAKSGKKAKARRRAHAGLPVPRRVSAEEDREAAGGSRSGPGRDLDTARDSPAARRGRRAARRRAARRRGARRTRGARGARRPARTRRRTCPSSTSSQSSSRTTSSAPCRRTTRSPASSRRARRGRGPLFWPWSRVSRLSRRSVCFACCFTMREHLLVISLGGVQSTVLTRFLVPSRRAQSPDVAPSARAKVGQMPHPTLAQARANAIAYCVIPLGSAVIHATLPQIKVRVFAAPSSFCCFLVPPPRAPCVRLSRETHPACPRRRRSSSTGRPAAASRTSPTPSRPPPGRTSWTSRPGTRTASSRSRPG